MNFKDKIHSEEFLKSLLQKQFRLSIRIGSCFGVVLFGLPLINYLFPEIMNQRWGGFTLSWLILGVLLFPFIWILSWIFIKSSGALEVQEAREALSEEEGKNQ